MHGCFAGVNAALERHGKRLILSRAPDGNGGDVWVPVMANDPIEGYRGDEYVPVARFCPFCGEQLRAKRGD